MKKKQRINFLEFSKGDLRVYGTFCVPYANATCFKIAIMILSPKKCRTAYRIFQKR